MRVLLSLSCVAVLALIGAVAQPLDSNLNQETERLISSYATFKKYPVQGWQDVYNGLEPDRRAVFDAIVRALFVEPTDSRGRLAGPRLITFVQELRGIWGVRRRNRDGKTQFRLSVVWNPAVLDLLRKAKPAPGAPYAGNFDHSINGHVLMPGGDDVPGPTAPFAIDDRDVTTYRQATRGPRLQLSFWNRDTKVGEVDLDYHDDKCLPLTKACHCTPSNSDVGSVDPNYPNSKDAHLEYLNNFVRYFQTPLTLNGWSDTGSHCKASY